MGWSIGYMDGRDVGYGVPCTCEYPDCKAIIDRGLAFKCGEWRSDDGCGLYFCYKHLVYEEDSYGETLQFCEPCCINVRLNRIDPENGWKSMVKTYDMKPDRKVWIRHKLTHHSWQQWRDENQDEVVELSQRYGIKPKVKKNVARTLKPTKSKRLEK